MSIRNNPGQSAYLGGGHRTYGRYQWCIKYYGFRADWEIEVAQQWAFGDWRKQVDGQYGFDGISDLLGRPIDATIHGRSGGWLVVDSELSPEELRKLDEHVAACMVELPAFLANEREFRAAEEREAKEQERIKADALAADPRVAEIKRLIEDTVGSDAALYMRGIRIV